MDTFFNNLVLYSTPILWTAFVTITFITKSILKKYGYGVTYMNISPSDYRNLKKLTDENPKLHTVYRGLIISSIGAILSFILFLVSSIFF